MISLGRSSENDHFLGHSGNPRNAKKPGSASFPDFFKYAVIWLNFGQETVYFCVFRGGKTENFTKSGSNRQAS